MLRTNLRFIVCQNCGGFKIKSIQSRLLSCKNRTLAYPSDKSQISFQQARRYLYTDDWLGANKFKEWRRHWYFSTESVISRIKFLMSNGSEISKDDLRSFLSVVDVDRLDLLVELVKRYHQQWGSYDHNSSVAMVYYVLNEPERGKNILLDKELSNYFTNVMSYSIIMQLLYNCGRHSDVCEVFDLIAKKGFPMMPITISLAAHCHINTTTSLRSSLALLDKMCSSDRNPIPRHLALVASLALNQDRPEVAFAITNPSVLRYLTPLRMGTALRSLQVISLARLGRVEEAFSLIKKFSTMRGSLSPLYLSPDARDAVLSADYSMESHLSHIDERVWDGGRCGRLGIKELVFTPITPKPFPTCQEAKLSYREKVLLRKAETLADIHNA